MTQAAELHIRFWDGVLPVDLGEIARGLGIKMVRLGRNDVQKGLSAALHWHQEEGAEAASLLCRFNPEQEQIHQRVAIAHCIARHVLNPLGRNDVVRVMSDTFTQRADSQVMANANVLALSLLVPKEIALHLIGREKISRIEDLSEKLGISHSAMRWILIQHGILA